MMGLNNIELITDRPLDGQPARDRRGQEALSRSTRVIVSLMVESKREAWHEIVKRAEDAGADGLELNFGCPHGMSERGMGSAVGQVPEYACEITELGQGSRADPGASSSSRPTSPTSARSARAARRGGADALSLINTINSIIGVDLDTLAPAPRRRRPLGARRLLRPGGQADRAAHGAALAPDPEIGLPDLRHRRHLQLARRGRVHPARLRHRAGLHRGHALRLPHRRGHDRRPRATACDEKGFRTHRRPPRPRRPRRHRVGRPRPQLQDRRRASTARSASAASSATSPARTARTSASTCDQRPATANPAAPSTATPRSPSRRSPNCRRGHTPPRAHPARRRSRTASAAISARWSAR